LLRNFRFYKWFQDVAWSGVGSGSQVTVVIDSLTKRMISEYLREISLSDMPIREAGRL